MEENKPKDKLKKLKNKKKDVISINPLEMLGKNPLKNNFKDKTKEEIKNEKKLIEENKINSQPLSSNQIFFKKNKNDIKTNYPYILPDDKKNISLIKNIAAKFENLFSYNDIVEERIVKLISPLLTVDNYNSILEERESLDICGNFLCGKKIEEKIPDGVFSYDKVTKKHDSKHISNVFCSKNCLDTFQNFVKSVVKNKNYDNLLILDNILIFESLQDYYDKDETLTKISELGNKLLKSFIINNKDKEKQIREYCDNKRIELTKLFADNFDEVLNQLNK